mgnify:CR=1 FL=1
MKKLLLLFAVGVMSFTFHSCRETSEERTDDAIEMGDDIDSRETRLETEENLEEHTESRIEEAEETDDLN